MPLDLGTVFLPPRNATDLGSALVVSGPTSVPNPFFNPAPF